MCSGNFHGNYLQLLAQYFNFEEARAIFMTQVQDCNVSAHNVLYGWNVILPPGISQM